MQLSLQRKRTLSAVLGAPILLVFALVACRSTSGGPPRDPAPLIEALKTVAPPNGTLPGPRGAAHLWKADIEVVPRDYDDHAVTLTARVTLDITPSLAGLPVHERGWSGIAMQGLLRQLGDHYIGELLQAGWAADPKVPGAWQRSVKSWRVSTPVFEVLSTYPPEAGTAVRLLLTKNGSVSVTASLKPDGMNGTPGPNLQPGDTLQVVIQVLGEERGFAALADG